jgi:3-oxoacyl-[acyl-carrier-protein] synthase III
MKIELLWELFTQRYTSCWLDWQRSGKEDMEFVLVLFADGAGAFIMFDSGNVTGRSDFDSLDEGIEQLQNELSELE